MSNRITNHALAVGALIGLVRKLKAGYDKSTHELQVAAAQLSKFQQNCFDDFISKELDRMKDALIDHIKEF